MFESESGEEMHVLKIGSCSTATPRVDQNQLHLPRPRPPPGAPSLPGSGDEQRSEQPDSTSSVSASLASSTEADGSSSSDSPYSPNLGEMNEAGHTADDCAVDMTEDADNASESSSIGGCCRSLHPTILQHFHTLIVFFTISARILVPSFRCWSMACRVSCMCVEGIYRAVRSGECVVY